MKKKILTAIACASMALSLSACDFYNKQTFDFNYKFDKVHVYDTGKCYKIKSWTDFEEGDQIQVDIEGKGVCLFHSSSIILVADKCPICEK